MAYLIIHCTLPLLFASFALIYYFVIRKWAAGEPVEEPGDDDDKKKDDDKKDKDKKDDDKMD